MDGLELAKIRAMATAATSRRKDEAISTLGGRRLAMLSRPLARDGGVPYSSFTWGCRDGVSEDVAGALGMQGGVVKGRKEEVRMTRKSDAWPGGWDEG